MRAGAHPLRVAKQDFDVLARGACKYHELDYENKFARAGALGW
jgi:hypothetical protein